MWGWSDVGFVHPGNKKLELGGGERKKRTRKYRSKKNNITRKLNIKKPKKLPSKSRKNKKSNKRKTKKNMKKARWMALR